MSDYFPHDLQIQILKRLPLNTLLTCRTVCKSWNNIITGDHFINTHLSFTELVTHNTTQSLLIRYFDRTRKVEKYIVTKDNESFGLHFFNIVSCQYASKSAYLRVVGYCDGVVCLTDDLFDSMHMVILWNPSIRKSVRVPIPNHEQGTVLSVLGFGVCPMTRDPKIVRLVLVDDSSIPDTVEVFSLKSGGWRKASSRFTRTRKTIRVTWSQVCFNGVIHWVAVCDKACLIVSFDLVREVFDEMLLPDGLARQDVSCLSISKCKGRLTMLDNDMEKGKESCGVWVMKEYGVARSWEKVYVIRLPGMLRRVVGFRMNGDSVLALKNHELVFVDCTTGNVKSLGKYANIRSFFIGSYTESLVLINHHAN